MRQLELLPLDEPDTAPRTKLELSQAAVGELVAAMVQAMLAVLRERGVPRREKETDDER